MNCDAYIELMSAALDGECTPEERRKLDSHLVVCPSCAALYRQMAAQTAALRELDCQVPMDLKARILDNLPEQQQPKKQGKVTRLLRWAPVAAAACLVLVVALAPMGLRAGSSSAPNANAPMATARDGSEEAVYGLPKPQDADGTIKMDSTSGATAPGTDVPKAAATPPSCGAPDFYGFDNPQAIRVSWGATPEAPSALVIDSVEKLADYLAQFSSQSWDGEGTELPIPGFDKLTGTYGEDFFETHRLLCVVVESGSGSTRYELAAQGLKRDSVTVVEHVPEVGTCDMAAWLLTAEVDTMFNGGDTLEVRFIEG